MQADAIAPELKRLHQAGEIHPGGGNRKKHGQPALIGGRESQPKANPGGTGAPQSVIYPPAISTTHAQVTTTQPQA